MGKDESYFPHEKQNKILQINQWNFFSMYDKDMLPILNAKVQSALNSFTGKINIKLQRVYQYQYTLYQ